MWALLRKRLDETKPAFLESRSDFLVRLRRAVAWMNENMRTELHYLCFNQKERAKDVLSLEGARTKW